VGTGNESRRLAKKNLKQGRGNISLAVMTLLKSFVTARSELEIRAREMACDIGVQKPSLLL
jgi:hypothetical protein